MRLGDQKRPSVQRLIPLSSSSKTKTEPEAIILRSESTSLRVTLGMTPRLAASSMRRASPVVAIQPVQGGSDQPLVGALAAIAVARCRGRFYPSCATSPTGAERPKRSEQGFPEVKV